MNDKERLEELFPVLPGTHTDIPYDQMKWLLERNFLPLNCLWQWHGPDTEGKPYHVVNHGYGKYDDGTGETGQGWWADRWEDYDSQQKRHLTGHFFRTPWEALADVVFGNGKRRIE
jgi:hypothetical protein